MKKTGKLHRALACLLAACMLMTLLPVSALADEDGGAVTVAAFEALDGAVAEQTVPFGTAREDLTLPDALQATVYTTAPDTETVEIGGVTWEPDAAYEGEAGDFTFIASAEGYVCADGVEWPVVTVTVEEQPVPEPTAYDAALALFAALPAPEAVADMTDGEKEALAAQISEATDALDALPEEDYAQFLAGHGDYLELVAALQDALTGGAETLADGGIATVDALNTAIAVSSGTTDNPTVITIDAGGITVGTGITIDGKHVKLTGGTLTRATTFTGNLIEVKGGGSLTLENITLDGNKSNASGGCLINLYNAALILETGATLTNNPGSAINIGYHFNNLSSSITMNGGTISNNVAASGGAIKDTDSNTVITIKGGKITGNTANGTDTNSTYGGGIYSNGKLIVTGGEITGNSVPNGRGGGIFKTGGKTQEFTVTGGTISGNTARADADKGDNIYVNQCAFTLGGAANIPDGLYLKLMLNSSVQSTFTIASALQKPVEIEAIYGHPAVGNLVASGAAGDPNYTITADDLAKFSYKGGAFSFVLDTDNNQIKLGEKDTTPKPSWYTNAIYANGAPLLLMAGSSDATKTVVYIDKDRSGTVTDGDPIVSFNVNGVNDATTAGNDLRNYAIYGGSGRNSNADNTTDYTGDTSITMLGGEVSAIYGGSEGIGETTGTVTGNTSVTVSGGTVTGVYGGGNKAGGNNVDGNTAVTITGNAVVTKAYGGGNGNGAITGNSTLTISGGTVGQGGSTDWICGGGNGPVNGTASVTISGGAVKALVFGGGDEASGTAASSVVTVTGGEVSGALYGGGFRAGTTGAASVTMTGGILSKNYNVSPADGRIYGGNYSGAAGSQTVTVGNAPILAGVVIGTTNGVSSVAIEPDLSGTVPLILPSGFSAADKPIVATGAVESDLSHLSLSGPNAAELTVYFDETDSTVRVRNTFTGKGTAAEPYLIETYADLATLAEKVNSGADYKNKVFQVSGSFDPASGAVTTPIGTYDDSFAGTFDGSGKTITLNIDRYNGECMGLFGRLDNGGTVKNTGVKGSVKGYHYVGGIAGGLGGTVENCWSTATVTGTQYAGGIAGTVYPTGAVRSSWNAGAVAGGGYVGGVAGMNFQAVQDCYNTGSVTGSASGSNVGGVVGSTSTDTTLKNCYNTGAVSGGGSNVGGVSGFSSSSAKVTGCVSLGETVTGSAATLGRVVGNAYQGGGLTNNKARADQRIGAAGSEAVPVENLEADEVNGQNAAVDNTSALTEVFSGWNSSVWSIPDGSLRIGCQLPTLRGCTQSSAPVLPGELIAPAIITEALPAGTLGASYSQTLTAAGTAPITWSITSGRLPDGLTLSSGGVITGTPTAVGTFSFTVKAGNPWIPPDATKELSIVVARHPGTGYSGYPAALEALQKVHIVTNVTPTLADVALPDGWAFTGDKTARLAASSENEGKQSFSVQYTPADTNYAPVLLTGSDAPQFPVSTVTLTAADGLDMKTVQVGGQVTLSGITLQVTGAALPSEGAYAITSMKWHSSVKAVATVTGEISGGSNMSATVTAVESGVSMVGVTYQNDDMLGYVLVKVTGGDGTANQTSDIKNIAETLDKLIDPERPSETDKAAVDAVADEVTKLPETAKQTLTLEDVKALDELKQAVGENISDVDKKLTITIKDDPEEQVPAPENVSVVGAAIACGVDSGNVVVTVKPVQPSASDAKLELQMGMTVDGQTKQPESPMFFQMEVPEGINLNRLTLYHVKDDGSKTVLPFTVVSGRAISFKMLSFSSVQFVVSAGSTTGGTATYTLDAAAGEGGKISPSGKVSVAENGGMTFTVTPDEGYEIADVRVDGRSVGAVSSYTFENVTADHVIEARFRASWNPFIDVKSGDWYHDSVKYVYESGLMLGTGKNTFSPGLTTTRGMIVTILWRLEREPESGSSMPFTDVNSGRYYYEAVRWAAEHGIVNGYAAGAFRPDNAVTRQELAAILYRYAQYKGKDVSVSDNLADFTDRPDRWAEKAVKWAVGAGILNGKGEGILDPGGYAARAEAAAMLARFLSEAAGSEQA